MSTRAKVALDKAQVLTEATLAAAEKLTVKQADLAAILGVSSSTVSRLAAGKMTLEGDRPVVDSAATFVLVYRSLASILGSNLEHMKAWLTTYNTDLASVPLKLMLRPSGLHQVRGYLDAYRGRC
ncbi:antitoxin Xre/MbcA/ParS toxin-binding domain-containing protein [Chitinimonas arctica]|nr:antitoxin Xre/MbcA/ParS toxin-binding domain-containing protein [Chitinimonas arctica]